MKIFLSVSSIHIPGDSLGEETVPHSVLDAIKAGTWDYEPEEADSQHFDSTVALPGTDEKLAVLAERVSRGLPLWHPEDRRSYDESDRE